MEFKVLLFIVPNSFNSQSGTFLISISPMVNLIINNEVYFVSIIFFRTGIKYENNGFSKGTFRKKVANFLN